MTMRGREGAGCPSKYRQMDCGRRRVRKAAWRRAVVAGPATGEAMRIREEDLDSG